MDSTGKSKAGEGTRGVPRIAVLFSSGEGQTEKIMGFVANGLTRLGFATAMLPVSAAVAPRGFDAVVLGGSIHLGRYDDELVSFVRRYREELGWRPSAFVSVCLAAARNDPAGRRIARGYIDALARQTGFEFDLATSVAGAVRSKNYGVLKRRALRAAVLGGGALDGVLDPAALQDREYTDWSAVSWFVARFAQQLGNRADPPLVPTLGGITHRDA